MNLETEKFTALIDPAATKVITVGGLKMTIKPLTPELQCNALHLYVINKKSDEPTDIPALKEVIALAITEIDRTSIPDNHSLKNASDLDCIKWLTAVHTMYVFNMVVNWMGLTEEEVKNSPCLSEQDSQESPASVTTKATAKEDKEPVSTTLKMEK